MKKILPNILALLTSLIIGVFLSEVAMRLFYPQDEYLRFVIADPILQTSNARDFDDNLRFGSVRASVNIKINSMGMRGPEINLDDTSASKILLLGDSFTFGWAMPESLSFAFLLEQNLKSPNGPDVKILNSAVCGWGTLQQITYLENNWEILDPDLVVVTFVPNDIIDDYNFDSWRSGKSGGPSKFFGKNLIVKLHLFRFFNLKLKKIMADNALKERLKIAMERNPSLTPDRFTWVDLFRDQDWLHLRESYDKLYSVCLARNTQLLIQNIAYGSEPLDSFFKDFVRERPLAHFCSLSPIYEKFTRDQLYIPNDGHWTALGNQAVSSQLSETILSDSLLVRRFQ